ncbi:MAG: hypothetical protein R2755_14715 [Acidimicrobiales bacterium]
MGSDAAIVEVASPAADPLQWWPAAVAAPRRQAAGVPGVDGAWHPLRRLARSDAQLVALAVQLARAECLHPERPLVLDDVLIGLDDRNLQAVCAVLANLAEHRQVLVLTGSVAVTDALRRARRGTRVLELR